MAGQFGQLQYAVCMAQVGESHTGNPLKKEQSHGAPM